MWIPEIPNNSLTKEITKIVELSQQLENDYAFEYNRPVAEEEFISWENEYKIKIPESLKNWLRFSGYSNIRNGLIIIRNINDFKVGCEIVPEDLVIVGEAIGDGELICFSKETGQIVWEDHGEFEFYEDFRLLLNEIIRMMKGDSGLSEGSIDALMALLNDAKENQ